MFLLIILAYDNRDYFILSIHVYLCNLYSILVVWNCFFKKMCCIKTVDLDFVSTWLWYCYFPGGKKLHLLTCHTLHAGGTRGIPTVPTVQGWHAGVQTEAVCSAQTVQAPEWLTKLIWVWEIWLSWDGEHWNPSGEAHCPQRKRQHRNSLPWPPVKNVFSEWKKKKKLSF